MFDCGAPVRGEFLCRFTSNELFTSGALEVNRHEFEDSQYQNRESHASELSGLLNSVSGDFSDNAVAPPQSSGNAASLPGINLSQPAPSRTEESPGRAAGQCLKNTPFFLYIWPCYDCADKTKANSTD